MRCGPSATTAAATSTTSAWGATTVAGGATSVWATAASGTSASPSISIGSSSRSPAGPAARCCRTIDRPLSTRVIRVSVSFHSTGGGAMKLQVAAVGVLVFGVVAGCGDSGPKRLRLTGTATFDGKPIPYGDVVFTPDGSQKNSGPQGIAQIRDGKYDTAGSDGKGFAGGPTVVHVTGLTGPGGKL